MEIKNTTKFSKEGYFTLNKTLTSKTFLACIGFEVALAALLVFIIIKDNDIVKPIFLGVLMLLYPFTLYLIMKFQMNRNYNLNKAAYEDMVYDYVFTDEQLNVRLTHQQKTSEGHITYRAMYKVIETEHFLFVFISSNQAYIVEKANFSSKEEFDRVISKIKEENVKYKYSKVKDK